MRSALLFVAGLLIIASAGAHGLLSWPSQGAALQQVNAPADLVTGLAIGWYFGTAGMLTFGVIVLAGARRLWRGDRSVGVYLWPIATAYLLFGLAALVATSFSPQFLIFVATGALIALPLLGISEQ